jgi:phenylacetate-coenzyme A ligase PaaK-like adenylate-forming protein
MATTDRKTHGNVTSSLSQINNLLAPYIPPEDTWNPVDKVIYPVIDPYRAPVEGAQDARFEALKWAFAHHYTSNYFYHKYCVIENVGPDDIKTVEDLKKIPLIPDTTFKQYPSGKDFARWLATMYTGHLPQIEP